MSNSTPSDVMESSMLALEKTFGFNTDDIQKTLDWSFQPGETFEIRILESQTKPWAKTASGYFRDTEIAVKAITDYILEYQPKQVYCTLNPTIPDLYARARDHIQPGLKSTTNDEEIVCIRSILIDCDPVRPTGIPSNEEELDAAEKKASQVKEWLEQYEFPPPMIGMSGNGYHLRYAVNLELSDKPLVKELLEMLASQFDDSVVKIDCTVYNPGRVAKLYGTFSCKGDDADGRVNRLSRIVECPERQEVTREQIQAVINELRLTSETANNNTYTDNHGLNHVDIKRFLDHRKLQYRDDEKGKYVLKQCVFDPSHNHGEVAVFKNANGSLGYHCFHNSCADKKWPEFVEIVGKVTRDDYADQPTESQVISGGIIFDARPASLLAPHESLDWVWEGYLARKHICLMTALWKSGKSTLLGHLMKQMQKSGDKKPLGKIAMGKVMVVSEESQLEWKTRCEALGISDDHRFLCRPFAGKPWMGDYLKLIDYLAAAVTKDDYDLVVLDTLGHFSPVNNENDAAMMMRALIPLNKITEAGAALLINHHPRKSQGEEGLSTRGSGALAGFASILMELRRYDPSNELDCRRKLKVLSRFEVPPEAIVELKDSNYRIVGSLSETKAQDRWGVISKIVQGTSPGLRVEEIMEQWPGDSCPSRRTIADDLAVMVKSGIISSTGAGVKNDPCRFHSGTL